ncbi:MAG: threonine/serine dehydratase [Betaproteobacteria bacterium]
MVSRDDIVAAQRRLFDDFKPFLRRTPMLKVNGAEIGVACAEVWFKLEHLQVGGSFKARGMLNRLLSNPIPGSGVIIASGGNAGIACAQAANALEVRCEVFVPELCPPVKQQKLAALGATVIVGGAFYPQALEACFARQQATGALLVHAYDQPEVVAGAGTLAPEIEAQAGLPDAVLVSVGGGGLIAGLAAGFEARATVVALEPERCPTLFEARRQRQPVDVDVGGIAADSLGARRIGRIAWAVTERWVEHSLLVSDEAIRAAQLWLWREMKLAVEPSAAVPLAALQSGVYLPRRDETLCLIVCGANFDPAVLT